MPHFLDSTHSPSGWSVLRHVTVLRRPTKGFDTSTREAATPYVVERYCQGGVVSANLWLIDVWVGYHVISLGYNLLRGTLFNTLERVISDALVSEDSCIERTPMFQSAQYPAPLPAGDSVAILVLPVRTREYREVDTAFQAALFSGEIKLAEEVSVSRAGGV